MEGNAQFHRGNKGVIFFLPNFNNLPRLIQTPELEIQPLSSLGGPAPPRGLELTRPLRTGLQSFRFLAARPRLDPGCNTRCRSGLSPPGPGLQ